MQSHPGVVDGTLYVTTPSMKVAAVDAASGRERWTFSLAPAGAPRARFRHRGVTVHAGLGNIDQAFRALDQAVADRSNWLVWLKLDPRFDNPWRSPV